MDKKEKRTCIIRWIVSVCLIVISVLMFLYISKSYARNVLFQKSHSFVWVSILLFLPFVLMHCRMHGLIKGIRLKSKILNGLYFLGIPAVALLIEEIIWNESLTQMSIKILVLNYVLVLIITLCLCLIIMKAWVSYTIVLVFHWLYGLINHYVLLFKGRPPIYTDLLAVKTATSVMGSYVYELTNRIIYGTLLLLFVLVFLHILTPADWKICTEKKSAKIVFHVLRFAVSAGLVITVLNINIGERMKLSIDAWKPTESMQYNGAPISMLISIENLHPSEPEGYSKEAVYEILDEYTVEDGSNVNNEEKPLVIAIMNETFSDLGVLGPLESEDYLSYWDSLDSYVMRGNVYTSVVGGGTCNSEFEFLTGDTMANISSAGYPYQNYNLESTFNIVEYLKDVQGYNTVAFHPYQANNWNRPAVYRNFGFNTFLSIEDMTEDEISYVSWGASDACDYNKVEQIVEENQDHPLFLFNVTMQNHGGYVAKIEDEYPFIQVEGKYAGYTDVVKYLTLIRESDHAFEDLIAYLEEYDKPVVLCMFGDHQPALDEGFIQDITSSYSGDSEIEKAEQRYITPYMIWSNYDTGVKQVQKDMSLNYLGANLLDVMGYRTTYTNYLLNLEKEIPIMNLVGYRTKDDVWHSWDEENALADDYKKVQYYEMLGRKNNEY